MSDNKTPTKPEADYEVVVIGAGAAGLNAALVLGRARRRVAVIDAGQPRNAPATHMHGYLSRDGMPPSELLAAGRAEVAGYGVDVIDGYVERIEPGFSVHLAGGRTLKARRILVATGLRDDLPGIPGLRERWGVDVLHCPYCHGYEIRDQPVGVLATQPGSVHQALLVGQWSKDVVFLAHDLDLASEDRERLTARGVRLVDETVGRVIVDGDRLRGVELADGSTVPLTALFAAPVMVPLDTLLFGLDCERNADGWVAVDATGRTSVPGVWAAGNVTDFRVQVITAAAAGAAAAVAINGELVDEEVAAAVAAHRASGAAVAA